MAKSPNTRFVVWGYAFATHMSLAPTATQLWRTVYNAIISFRPTDERNNESDGTQTQPSEPYLYSHSNVSPFCSWMLLHRRCSSARAVRITSVTRQCCNNATATPNCCAGSIDQPKGLIAWNDIVHVHAQNVCVYESYEYRLGSSDGQRWQHIYSNTFP